MEQNTPNKEKKYSHLGFAEREELAILLEKGYSQREIAMALNRNPGTISREIRRNRAQIYDIPYRAIKAQEKADIRKKESHKRQRIPNRRLRRFICKYIKFGYSPEIIAFMITKKNDSWKTNYESIYQWIYIDRTDLIPFLTQGHKKRRKRGSAKGKRGPKIPNRVMIDKRPDHIQLRTRIGDWEADTIISRQSKVAIMVLVNRKARLLILKKIMQKTASLMHKAIVDSLKNFPQFVKESITYDNGTENALHELTNTILGTDSYFCHPYRSWEKGTVENLIGLVRRFYPKKIDWNNVTQWDLNKVMRYVNNRPMKCLGYQTPYEVFVALAA